jgi:hypothetical protein
VINLFATKESFEVETQWNSARFQAALGSLTNADSSHFMPVLISIDFLGFSEFTADLVEPLPKIPFTF